MINLTKPKVIQIFFSKTKRFFIFASIYMGQSGGSLNVLRYFNFLREGRVGHSR